VGSDRPVRVDARVICATNLSPEQLRMPERFRPDLLYRINTIEIRIPPLRERREDIPLLVTHYAQYYARKYGRAELSVPADTMARLKQYRWPGNVRELKHAVERAVIMSDSGSFPIDNIVLPAVAAAAPAAAPAATLNLDELEKQAIERALAQYQGNLTRAAQALGLGRTTLYRKMARHGLQ
jgi:DNA-binding NtrC family response regulator